MFFFKKENNLVKEKSGLSDHRLITHYYFLNHICLAMERCGVFDELKKKALSVAELSVRCSIEERLLSVCLEFLRTTSGLIKKDNGKYVLAQPTLVSVYWVLAAYRPVFENLSDILVGKKKYGEDLTRDGYYLQKASDIFSGNATTQVLGLVREEVGVLVDFGCGSADASIRYCRGHLWRKAIGIDVDPVIVREAKNHVVRNHLTSQINIVEADVMRVESWQAVLHNEKRLVFLASTMLHEFLRNGEDGVIFFIRNLKKCFPGSRFIIVEFDAIPFERLQNEPDEARKLFAAMYEVWHPLTNQGMPQPENVWRRIISGGGGIVKSVTRAKNDLLIYDCSL